MSQDTQEKLRSLVHRSARYLDDQDYDGFLALFTENGQYSITSYAPELPDKMIWMHRNRGELAERIAVKDEHEWEIAGIQQTRIISVDMISSTATSAQTSTGFSLYHTGHDGSSDLYVLGRYEDRWVMKDQQWLISEREVALRTRQLKLLSPMPV